MNSITAIAASLLSDSQRRIEVAAENVANLSTPGYKRRVAFSIMPSFDSNVEAVTQTASSLDPRPGKLQLTSNPQDLAILGDGFFTVRDGERIGYTRDGQFSRTGDGNLTTSQGFVLQAVDGGDLQLRDGDFSVELDGTVVQAGSPVGRIATARFRGNAIATDQNGLLSMNSVQLDESSASIRQGALESSNVASAEEMLTMMEALRRAEGGQRIMNVYDDLMGRVVSTMGQN